MPTTLPISRLISIGITLTAQAAQSQVINSMLLLTNDIAIDVTSRMRAYSTLAQVAGDLPTNSPAYLAASLWFAQAPQPTQLLIGRWAKTASSGQLFGAALNAATVLTTLQAVVSGGLQITVDGIVKNLSAMNLTAITNLNGAATIITTALAGSATVVWNSVFARFEVTSATTGAASIVSFASAGAGTDISSTLGLRSTSSGAYQANGIVPESALAAVTLFDITFGQQWFGLQIPEASDADHQAVAGYVEASTTLHFYGVTTQAAGTLLASSTTDVAYLLQQLGYKRTAVQYSSSSLYAVASLLGRILTVDYTGNNTTITLMYKQEPGIAAETLNTTQIAALEAKNCNVFVAYNNSTAIIENGTCASGDFIDTVIGASAFAIDIQTSTFNLLYTSPTKIPQTDAGTHQVTTVIESVCARYVTNGFLAPGVWNSAGFGSIKQGETLTKGYYVFAPLVSTQSVANRAARLSVPIQIAAKLAGAVHKVNLTIVVNQ